MGRAPYRGEQENVVGQGREVQRNGHCRMGALDHDGEGEDGGEDIDQGADAEHVPPEQDSQRKLAIPAAREEIAGCRRLHCSTWVNRTEFKQLKGQGSNFFNGVLAG